ncbi:unnamed protein product [Lactuca saligna]|uniref:Uncharacterized protein n=1 Tax=Lactuca saligna TaxID=75948 RepID=A0AA35V907_LACSI|nr:unnamed protein product [Lactuca saligna]
MHGLLEAVKEVMPDDEHRQCARHIFANFYKHFSGEIYKTLFWKFAKSTTDQEFKNNMEKMKELNNDTYDDVMKINPKTVPPAATSGGRGGKGPIGSRGGRGSSASTSGGRGGRSFIDEIFDSPMENEVIEMFDNFEEELHRAEMERREGEPLLQFPKSQFDDGVPITQDDGVAETQDVVPETQFDIEYANLEDQSNVVGGIVIDVLVIHGKLKPRKPSGRII